MRKWLFGCLGATQPSQHSLNEQHEHSSLAKDKQYRTAGDVAQTDGQTLKGSAESGRGEDRRTSISWTCPTQPSASDTNGTDNRRNWRHGAEGAPANNQRCAAGVSESTSIRTKPAGMNGPARGSGDPIPELSCALPDDFQQQDRISPSPLPMFIDGPDPASGLSTMACALASPFAPFANFASPSDIPDLGPSHLFGRNANNNPPPEAAGRTSHARPSSAEATAFQGHPYQWPCISHATTGGSNTPDNSLRGGSACTFAHTTSGLSTMTTTTTTATSTTMTGRNLGPFSTFSFGYPSASFAALLTTADKAAAASSSYVADTSNHGAGYGASEAAVRVATIAAAVAAASGHGHTETVSSNRSSYGPTVTAFSVSGGLDDGYSGGGGGGGGSGGGGGGGAAGDDDAKGGPLPKGQLYEGQAQRQQQQLQQLQAWEEKQQAASTDAEHRRALIAPAMVTPTLGPLPLPPAGGPLGPSYGGGHWPAGDRPPPSEQYHHHQYPAAQLASSLPPQLPHAAPSATSPTAASSASPFAAFSISPVASPLSSSASVSCGLTATLLAAPLLPPPPPPARSSNSSSSSSSAAAAAAAPLAGISAGSLPPGTLTGISSAQLHQLPSDSILRITDLDTCWSELRDLAFIGAGACGNVYGGTWCGMPVAAKFMLTSDAGGLQRQQREAALSRFASHPHMVQAYAVATSQLTHAHFCNEASARQRRLSAFSNAADLLGTCYEEGGTAADLYGSCTTSMMLRSQPHCYLAAAAAAAGRAGGVDTGGTEGVGGGSCHRTSEEEVELTFFASGGRRTAWLPTRGDGVSIGSGSGGVGGGVGVSCTMAATASAGAPRPSPRKAASNRFQPPARRPQIRKRGSLDMIYCGGGGGGGDGSLGSGGGRVGGTAWGGIGSGGRGGGDGSLGSGSGGVGGPTWGGIGSGRGGGEGSLGSGGGGVGGPTWGGIGSGRGGGDGSLGSGGGGVVWGRRSPPCATAGLFGRRTLQPSPLTLTPIASGDAPYDVVLGRTTAARDGGGGYSASPAAATAVETSRVGAQNPQAAYQPYHYTNQQPYNCNYNNHQQQQQHHELDSIVISTINDLQPYPDAAAAGRPRRDSFELKTCGMDTQGPLLAPYHPSDVLGQIGARPGQWLTVVIMEEMDCGSLHRAIHGGLFDAAASRLSRRHRVRGMVRTLVEVAAGMAALHASGLVHGDLKPANVLLKAHPRDARGFIAKVSDFGSTRVMAEGASAGTVSSSDWGTVIYTAPEVFNGKSGPPSDVYSFGALIWHLTTGKLPHEDINPFAVLLAVSKGELGLDWPASVPKPLRKLGQLCMQHDAAARPTFPDISRALLKLERRMRSISTNCSTPTAAAAAAATTAAGVAEGPPAPPVVPAVRLRGLRLL